MQPENTPKKKNTGIIVGISVVIVVAIVAAIAAMSSSSTSVSDSNASNAATTTSVPTTSTLPVTATVPPADTSKQLSVYKNGSYTASGSYDSPGGLDHVTVNLTLANDLITDISVTATGDRESQQYQAKFLSGYKQYVLGKNIATLKLTKVSGSSLTSGGFNDAVAQIKTQAKAKA